MDYLKEYQKQLAIDEAKGKLETDKLPDDVRKRVEEIKNDPLDPANAYKRFHDTFTKQPESKLSTKDNVVTVVIRKAYCPKCGKEIVSNFPIMINPYTNERIGRYECECGEKMNLEYSYPRTVYLDSDGNEIIVQN